MGVWDDQGIEEPSIDDEECNNESIQGGEEYEEGEEGERIMWLPGPRTQGCNALVDMFRCKTLVLAGRAAVVRAATRWTLEAVPRRC